MASIICQALIEGGAQGLRGLHYVCHDAALRSAAAAVMNQSKRVAHGGGAWHGGALRTETISGTDRSHRLPHHVLNLQRHATSRPRVFLSCVEVRHPTWPVLLQ